jgi:hypothetical protein
MRRVCALAMLGLLAAVPAYGQSKQVPQYGDIATPKSPAEIEAERQTERAYKRSMGNVPDAAASTDPWGNVRGGAATPAAKAPAKRTKDNAAK